MLRRINLYVIGIVLLGLIVRLVGVTHGYPFIFHPDEPTVVRSALGLRYNLNPDHFDWPHFFYYINFAVYAIFLKIRPILTADLWRGDFAFYVLTRALAAIFGALTAIPVYLTGKQLFNAKVGLLGALFMAILPLHVWNSHYTLIDVPMVFWLAWGIYFSAKILTGVGATKNYLLAGIFFGFAASTKYNGALGYVFLLLAFLLSTKLSLKSAVKPLLSGVALVCGFIAGTPFALLDLKTFLIDYGPQGALWQFTNVGKVDFFRHLQHLVDAILKTLPDDFGYTVFLAYFLLLGLLVYRKIKYGRFERKLLFIVIPPLLFFYYISGFYKVRSQYFFITYPAVVISAAYFLNLVWEKYAKMGLLLITVAVVIPLGLTINNDIIWTRNDTKVELYNWLIENAREADQVIYNTEPLKQIVLKARLKSIVKSSDSRYMTGRTGYFIYNKDTQSEPTFIFSKYYELKLVNTISSEGRTGDSIFIYTFNGIGKNASTN